MTLPTFSNPLLAPLTGYQAAETKQVTTAALASSTPGNASLSFLDALNAAKPVTAPTLEDDEKQMHKVAGDLIANALVLPVMKQIRHDVFAKNNIFSGGVGENTFGPEFDMQIADRIAHSPQMTATNNLADRLLARKHPELKAGRMKSGSSLQSGTQKLGVDVHG